MTAIAKFFEDVKQPRTRTRRRLHLHPIEVAVDDAKRRATSGDWEGAKGSTFIGLHALCHRMVYGIIPEELYAEGVMRAAVRNAASALHQMFGDDGHEMADFVRWTWEREKRKSTWAQANGYDRNRLMWKWQFSRSLLTDYRIARSQKTRR